MKRVFTMLTILSMLSVGLMAAADAEAGCNRYKKSCKRRPAPRPAPVAPFRRGNPPPPSRPAVPPPRGPVGPSNPVGPNGPNGPLANDPVNPANPANPAINIPAGSTILLPGNRGEKAGAVYLLLDGLRLPLIVEEWAAEGITVTLPSMQLNSAKQVKIEIVRSGAAAETIDVVLNPPPKVIVKDQPVVVTAPPAPVAAR